MNEKEDQWESELNALMEKSADLNESTENTTSKEEGKQSFHDASSPSKRLESKHETSKNIVKSSSTTKSNDGLSTVPSSVASSTPQNNEIKRNSYNKKIRSK